MRSLWGGVVGISILDEVVVVHKQTSTMVFAGPGPDADGGLSSQNAFTPVDLLTSDAGCSSSRSIVVTPNGNMFASSKGIMLIGRDRQTNLQVGSAVYGYKDQNISRATLIPDRRQVVFLTDDPDGRSLLYDYEHGQWSTFTNDIGFDAAVVGGSYIYLRTDGRVFQETPGIYADDNNHIPMLISTAWVKLAGYLQAFQKIIHAKILGQFKSPHTLRMRYRLDYMDAWSSPIDVDVSADYDPSLYGEGIYGVGPYGQTIPLASVYQQSFHINRRCQAIAFEFSDRESDGIFGASFELSELILTGGVLGSAFLPGANRSQ